MFVIARKKLTELFKDEDEYWDGKMWGNFPKQYSEEEIARQELEDMKLDGEDLDVIGW
jgi:hypothetical protein